MHTHLVAASTCCYKRITCMDEWIRGDGCKGCSELLSIYDLAVQSMVKLDSVTCFYLVASFKFWLVFLGETDRPCETKFWLYLKF